MIDYYLLTKPGIILGNLLTVSAGFLLASKGQIDFRFLGSLFGLAFIIASACVFNNYIDRKKDRKMERTKNRPLAKGTVALKNAIIFAVILGLFGSFILLLTTNFLAFGMAAIGFFVYVFLYSFLKDKTIYATEIGSIAGAMPPLVGYCAASNQFDLGALIFFLLLVFWQMPHFFSIAIYNLEDYARAQIPTFPARKGLFYTKIQMLLYISGFLVAISLLTFFEYTGYIFLASTLLTGWIWWSLCLYGFKRQNDQQWAKKMFYFSLVLITILCLTVPLDIL